MYVVQKRNLPAAHHHRHPAERRYYGSPSGDWYDPYRLPQATQETYSWRTSPSSEDPNMWPDPPSPGTWDTGHEFYTTKTSFRSNYPDVFLTFPTIWPAGQTRGALVFNGVGFPEFQRTSSSVVNTEGATLVNRALPYRPQASLAQFIGELKDLPQLVGAGLARKGISRGSAGEYLNLQFGWAPFISDLTKAVRSLRNSSEMLRILNENSGKVVRRRRELPDLSTSASKEQVNSSGGLLTMYGTGTYYSYSQSMQPISIETTTVTRRWFSGAFTYHIPIGDGVVKKLESFESQANYLLGLRLDASLLWELAPWSWLIDWFTTCGDAIQNAELLSADGQVMRYGYLMRETRTMVHATVPSIRFNNGWVAGPVSNRFLRVTKERFRANPFGFGITDASLTGRQWSILGALGMTKAPRLRP